MAPDRLRAGDGRCWLLGGAGLRVEPGSPEWWLARPVWFALYIAVLLPIIGVFHRWEGGFGPPRDGRPVPHWRLLLGLLLI